MSIVGSLLPTEGLHKDGLMIPSPSPKDMTVMIFVAIAWWLFLVGTVL